jgi:hypothetical protein
MTVCLGPFTASPQWLHVQMRCRDFVQDDLFKKSKNHEKHVLQDKSSGVYYLLLSITNELVLQDDICIFISAPGQGKLPQIDFRFWLNVNYVPSTRKLL